MSGPSAERFVVFSLRLLALSFATVGFCFLLIPGTVTSNLTDVGGWIGNFAEPPGVGMRLWLGLAFAYMIVITGICLIAQADPVRYRVLLLLLALAKTASSLAALGFFFLTDDVFIYLLNFVVDGSLVAVAVWLWVLTGRIGRPAAPG